MYVNMYVSVLQKKKEGHGTQETTWLDQQSIM